MFFSVLISLAIYLSWYYSGKNTATLVLTNHSGDEIRELKVILYDEPCYIPQLEDQASNNCQLEVDGDSNYKISWIEPGSQLLKEEFGYVTNGVNYRGELVFSGSGTIKLLNHEAY